MKIKIALAVLALSFLTDLTMAQVPHPQQFQIIYGKRDASPDTVMLGQPLQVPIWVRTDPNDYADSIGAMFNPLRSLNAVITDRDSGDCGGYQCPNGGQYECLFTAPVPNGPDSTSQGVIFIFDYGMGRPCAIWTGGDTVQVATFRMKVTENRSYAGRTICSFEQGYDPRNGWLMWGLTDGITMVFPIDSYSCLHILNISDVSGDANGDWSFNAPDIVFMVNYLKGTGNPPAYHWECAGGILYATADANGDCAFNAIDVTYCVNFLKGLGPAPRKCPSC
jgi:hypothetical protein